MNVFEISLIIFSLLYIYIILGRIAILFLIVFYLFTIYVDYNLLERKYKVLLNKNDYKFIYNLDSLIFKDYKMKEKRFFDILDESKLFINDKKYYKSLLLNTYNEMKDIFISFSLSTTTHLENDRLKEIYDKWYNNISKYLQFKNDIYYL